MTSEQLIKDSILQEQSAYKHTYNLSMHEEYARDKWKFIETMDEESGNVAGFLMRSPVPLLIITLSYILFVCFLGPLWMRNREPFQLKNIIRFYNLLMVLMAGILFTRIRASCESLDTLFDCDKTFTFSDQSASKIYNLSNLIIIVRLSEYLDTIFFTLRKKQNQVTFLHVFHHAFVPIYAFWALRTAPVRFNVYIIIINSFIHVLMYFYYFLATFQERPKQQEIGGGGSRKQARQGFLMLIVTKLLMFKRYMTQLQILQFISLAFYVLWAMVQPNRCNVPWTYIMSNLMLALGFLTLFLHFYISIYKKAAIAARATKRD